MNESRKQFEEFAEKQNLSLAYGDCGYVYSSTEMAWRAWQASRAAIEIVLDKEITNVTNKYYEEGRDDVIEAIRAAGIKVKE